jgi:hypothetical protein
VTASAFPVTENPFNFKLMPDAPNAIQGAPMTVQFTFPISWLSSVMVSVVEIVPRISAAHAALLLPRSPTANSNPVDALVRRIPHLPLLFGHRRVRGEVNLRMCPPVDPDDMLRYHPGRLVASL